jgi:hypothetical protein
MNLDTNPLLSVTPEVINLGLDGFNDSIRAGGGHVHETAWRPPGNADPALARALAHTLGDARVDATNEEATRRIIDARPPWTDVALRADAVWPRLREERVLLHAGAPLPWERMCGPMQGAMVGALLQMKAGPASPTKRAACWSAARSPLRSATTSAPWDR